VKRLLVLLITSALMLTGAVLYSQDTVKEDAAAEKTAEKSAEKKKNPTKAFEMGEIVVKDRAIANIEDASTTTEITEKDIKARGDKTLDQSLTDIEQQNKLLEPVTFIACLFTFEFHA